MAAPLDLNSAQSGVAVDAVESVAEGRRVGVGGGEGIGARLG